MREGSGTRSASGVARWSVLGLLSIALFGNYYIYDSIAPVADLLQRQLGYTDMQIGTLNAIYSLPNLFMGLIGGVLVDRFGASKVIIGTGVICLAGALLTAASPQFPVMATGRLLFGVGAETMITAVTVALALWFAGRWVAFAMALNLSVARAGSYAADLSPALLKPLYDHGWQAPLWVAVGFASVSLVAALLCELLDSQDGPGHPPEPVGRVRWEDVLRFNRSYWYLLAVCVLFYAVVFPFRSTFAIKFYQHMGGFTLADAGVMNSHVFLAAIFATPAFGWISDRFGRRPLLMLIGSALLALSFGVLALHPSSVSLSVVTMGLAFSLVPGVLWPAVCYLVSPQRLGTAFGVMTLLQNLGMLVGNLVAGYLNDRAGAGVDHPAGYLPMLYFFLLLSLGAVAFAILLLREDARPGDHRLEQPASG